MGEDVDHLHAHEGREPDRGTHEVGEDEERAEERNEGAVERHAAPDPAHRVLAHTEVEHPRSIIHGGAAREAREIRRLVLARIVEVLARVPAPRIELRIRREP